MTPSSFVPRSIVSPFYALTFDEPGRTLRPTSEHTRRKPGPQRPKVLPQDPRLPSRHSGDSAFLFASELPAVL